ncbi:CGNR zinc finger domain-containing protein [Luteibacter aegosomatis]|uniref:CGNR zinc finger domain-containing protein n=1 Tax=Luteibacter aegosomatis TaxID=2911537 RepID=UPI001FF8CA1F|nr:CGNR zinc finger domain-containing protein [Luteibacter aegosomatis]UPG84354.1 CGNR zinc finger domain-containing protein [Luteibacter aegosomatis]
MTEPRLPALFVADARGLDILNSIATPVDVPYEWLDGGEGLLDWLSQADLVPADVLAMFRTSSAPGELDAVAAQARELREWFRGFVYERKGAPLTRRDLDELAPLNRVLRLDDAFVEIVADEEASPLTLRTRRRWSSPESLLIPIARSMADLVVTENFADVKACEGPGCTLLFADHTRARVRRWCSMAVCGNRAKQAAHRERTKRH